jgi:hypothetical protein
MNTKNDDVFFQWKVENWCSWVEDILQFGFALPISKLLNKGDEFSDMMKYLTVNGVDTMKFENAIVSLIVKYSNYGNFGNYVGKLVDGLLHIKNSNTHKVLLSLLNDTEYTKKVSDGSYVATKIIQCYIYKLNIEDYLKDDIKNSGSYYINVDSNYSLGFLNNYLSFIRSQYSASDMLEMAVKILDSHDNTIREDVIIAKKINVILKDKFNEIYHFDKGRYLQEIYNFLISEFSKLDSPAYVGLLEHFVKLIQSEPINFANKEIYNKLQCFLDILLVNPINNEIDSSEWECFYRDLHSSDIYKLFSLNIELTRNLVQKYRINNEEPIKISFGSFDQTIANKLFDIILKYEKDSNLIQTKYYKDQYTSIKNGLSIELQKYYN